MDDGELLYLGCYTGERGGGGEGVVAARRDPVSGALTVIGTAAVAPSPSFLARHPTLPVLYAVNELREGAVSAWAVESDGSLRHLGGRITGDAEPCHLAVTADGRHLVTANYGGSIVVHPLNEVGAPGDQSDLLVHDGHGPDERRQDRPHPHMVSPAPDGGPLLAVDLGTDGIYRYEVEPARGRLLPRGRRTATRPGTGPRHLARHPNGRHCYVVGELDGSLTAYDLTADGALHERGRVGTSAGDGQVQPSEVAVRADGRFGYVANRGVDTVAVFALTDGVPRYVTEVPTGGDRPRHLALIGEHLYVANERSQSISIFTVDRATGVPTATVDPVAVPTPTCVLPFAP